MIFTQNSGDGRKQDAFTVRSSAISEEKRVLPREARQSVAEDPLEIGNEVAVVAGDAPEEG
jgi:hypothetical protein